ncbi:winged helix-turn-helix domain-containing protein [Paraburkholderia rhizosphaerae]|uniref:DNA-binding response OmpR family regulator n=1 Tax=Paraburkholderia rhizosphaerae TaxID=480658 RepID=A0A4V3HF50_9BURK|nr:winged helix-turn-helix domain-containing protein [Paraburkholderia rhizosphaerae]TDY51501.1 DNA-binding response OmpR family regulator [Paraburkholderia rhizosphaerae]
MRGAFDWAIAHMGTIAKILIVEWDTSSAELLWNEVRQAGHEPLAAFSVERAMTLIEQQQPQAVLLRWKLPDASGLSLINDLRTRAATSRMPIIVLGEEGADEDECIRALESGADDYVRRPFGMRELIARIQVVLRPIAYPDVRHRVSVETLTMDFDARRAFARTGLDQDEPESEVELQLGPTCYRLLRFFVENPYQVLSRKDIISNVWFGSPVKEGIVDVYVKSLRETLEPLQNSLAIETVRGVGFRLSSVLDVPRVPTGEAEQRARPAPLQQPAPPAAPASRARKLPLVEERPRAGALRNPPALVSDLSAAVEKIQHLQSLLQRKTEENRLLRDAVDAAKPMAAGGARASAQRKNKR